MCPGAGVPSSEIILASQHFVQTGSVSAFAQSGSASDGIGSSRNNKTNQYENESVTPQLFKMKIFFVVVALASMAVAVPVGE